MRTPRRFARSRSLWLEFLQRLGEILVTAAREADQIERAWTVLDCPGDRVRALERRDDPLEAGGPRERLECPIVADRALQVPDEGRVWRRADARADDVVGRLDVRDPVSDRRGDGLLERPRPRLDGLDPSAEQPHPLNVRLLPAHVLGPHVDDAL